MSIPLDKNTLDKTSSGAPRAEECTLDELQVTEFHRRFFQKKFTPWGYFGQESAPQPDDAGMDSDEAWNKSLLKRLFKEVDAFKQQEPRPIPGPLLTHYLAFLHTQRYLVEGSSYEDTCALLPERPGFEKAWDTGRFSKKGKAITLLSCFLIGKTYKEVREELRKEGSYPAQRGKSEHAIEKLGFVRLTPLMAHDQQPTEYSIYTAAKKGTSAEYLIKIAHSRKGETRLTHEHGILSDLSAVKKEERSSSCGFPAPRPVKDQPSHITIYSRLITPAQKYQHLDKFLEAMNPKQRHEMMFPRDGSTSFLDSLFDAVQWLHDHGISHCNLKPSKILYKVEGPEHIAVVDFTRARRAVDDWKSEESNGHIREIKIKKYTDSVFVESGNAGKYSDIYALGVLIGEFYLGRFDLTFPRIRLHLEMSGNLQIQSIVDRCTNESAGARPGIEALREELKAARRPTPSGRNRSLSLSSYSSRLMDLHVVSGYAHRIAQSLSPAMCTSTDLETLEKHALRMRDPEQRDVAWMLSKWGQVCLLSGDHESASMYFLTCLRIRRELRKTYYLTHKYLEYNQDFWTVEMRYWYAAFCVWFSCVVRGIPIASGEVEDALDEYLTSEDSAIRVTRFGTTNSLRAKQVLHIIHSLNSAKDAPQFKEALEIIESAHSKLRDPNTRILMNHAMRMRFLSLEYEGKPQEADYQRIVNETESFLAAWDRDPSKPGEHRLLEDKAESYSFLGDCLLRQCLESKIEKEDAPVYERSLKTYEEASNLAKKLYERRPMSLRLRRKLGTSYIDLGNARGLLAKHWELALGDFRQACHLLEVHEDDREYNIVMHYLLASLRHADLLQAMKYRQGRERGFLTGIKLQEPADLYHHIIQFCGKSDVDTWGKGGKAALLVAYYKAVAHSRLADCALQTSLDTTTEFSGASELYDQAENLFRAALELKNSASQAEWPLDDVTQVLRPRQYYLFMADFEEPPSPEAFLDRKWNLETIRVEPAIHPIFFKNGVAHSLAMKADILRRTGQTDAAIALLQEASCFLQNAQAEGFIPMTILDTLFEIDCLSSGNPSPNPSETFIQLIRKGICYPLFLRKLERMQVHGKTALELFFKDKLLATLRRGQQ